MRSIVRWVGGDQLALLAFVNLASDMSSDCRKQLLDLPRATHRKRSSDWPHKLVILCFVDCGQVWQTALASLIGTAVKCYVI